MNYAVEMGPAGAMIYLPSSIKTGSPIQVNRGIQAHTRAHTHTDSKVIS
jgi:hypothetical protein